MSSKLEWICYVPEGDDDEYISVEKWGRDHWSTLAYLETCATDYNGLIDSGKMRTDLRLHRTLAGSVNHDLSPRGSSPTRLNDGTEVRRHDDWSCAEDFAKMGYVQLYFRAINDRAFASCQARVELTETGRAAANKLRAYKAAGGSFSSFTLSAECVVAKEKDII